MGKRIRIPLCEFMITVFLIFVLSISVFKTVEAESTKDIIDISASGDNTVAIDNTGSLWIWGDNQFGQIGDGTTQKKLSPVKVMDDVASVDLGEHTSAAIKQDGSLWTWGHNNYGQLGDGTTTDKYNPVQVMDNVVSVSFEGSSSSAIKRDGSLWTWGYNGDGQLGDGTKGLDENKLSPVKVMDDVRSVSFKGNHCLAIKTDGTLWAWGANTEGQIGDGTTTDRLSPRLTPVKVMDDVTSVSAMNTHNAAIKQDGTLWTWGVNDHGQLGDGTTETRLSPTKIMDDVKSVSCGLYHGAAIKTDGTLWTWGTNSDGQLGDGTTETKLSPVKIMDNVKKVSCGTFHTVIIKTDGSLWTWGYNMHAQLGDGTTNDKRYPINISFSEGTTERFAINPNQVWGFDQSEISAPEWNHYLKFLNPAYSALGLLMNSGGGGNMCAGMVTSAIAISGHDTPPVNSFVLSSGKKASFLNEVKPNDISDYGNLYKEKASDFIKYAYVYQFTPLTLNEKDSHKDKLDELVEAVRNSVDGDGEYVEIEISGVLNEKDAFHQVLAMGIKEDSQDQFSIIIYDSNRPNDTQILNIKKENGNYISWNYKTNYLDWGTGKKNASISFTTTGNDFSRDMIYNPYISPKDPAYLLNFNYMFSTKDNQISIINNAGKEISLNGNIHGNSDVLKVTMDNIGTNETVTSQENCHLYWAKQNGEMQFKNGIKQNTIITAKDNTLIETNIPEKASLAVRIDDGNDYANISDINIGDTFEIGYNKYNNQGKDNRICIGGEAAINNVDFCKTESGIEVKGIKTVSIETSSGNMVINKTTIEPNGLPIKVIRDEDQNFIVFLDADENGVYEKEIANTSTEKDLFPHHVLIKIKAKKATYSEEGNIEYYTCTECGKFFSDATGTKEIAKYSWIIPKLNKFNQPMTVKVAKKTVKAKKLKKKAVTIKPITVKSAYGTVTYKITGGSKKSKKALKINTKTGKIKVKKGTKKGTYKVKVMVTASGNSQYKAGSKTVTVTVKVK